MLITFVWFISSPSSLVLILTSAYVNVYLCLKETEEYWKNLLAEKSSLDKFRSATAEQLQGIEDDVCAVCLQPMDGRARVTPCNHIFHLNCLRNCLKQNFHLCPICKRSL